MKKNRYLLCLLLSGLLLYYAVPRISMFSPGAEGVFAYAWLGFALIVIAGNLTGLLYTPKPQGKQQLKGNRARKRIKSRYYN
ncbi:YtxH domain-containing protein [Bacillus benzoevorans]|uniref:Accessory gene regulator protein AgrB n=1 Tax=Bacillus benzoevorans TaxID=1456 RepID=A0A7X0HUA9_9BACI|nr:YtxH domain-containing protein [Bacillus benzoevorans]MBB6445701.1 accessory gene regulator protein AgrB [Bacillus benzoevorans]